MGTAATMGGGSRGSYGLSESQIAFFMTMMRAYAGELSAVATDQIVKDLVRYNKGRDVQIPRFEVGPMQAQDLQQSFQMLTAIASSPQLQVPQEFVKELTLDIADQLGFNTDAIERGFENYKPLPAAQQIMMLTEQGSQVAQKAQQQIQNQGQPSPKVPTRPVGPVAQGGRKRTPTGASKPANTNQAPRPSPARQRARSAVSGTTARRTTSS
jgi:hypothetical protein